MTNPNCRCSACAVDELSRESQEMEQPAPAVDEDLLRELSDLAYPNLRGTSYRRRESAGRELLAEPVMQRLRAAWTGTTTFQLQNAVSALRDAERERDEARATKDMHKERYEELLAQVESPEFARYRIADVEADARRIAELEDEVERLRAAPQLPDVGPVELDDGDLMFEDGTHWHASTLDWRERDALRELAAVRAARAFLDAEAAAPDNDDEVDPRTDVVVDWAQCLINGDTTTVGPLDARELLARLDAHRARSAEGEVTK